MAYRPRPRPYYGPNGYGGGRGNGGYGGGYGNGAYAAGYTNGGAYHGGRGLPYGRGSVPGYGACPPMGAAMPSSSRGHGQGRGGWGAQGPGHVPALVAPADRILPAAMAMAEAAAGEVLLRLHPTVAAERRRHEVIDYARNLIGTTFGCEVYVFGSVPLKTYLPDGDVDITVLTNTHVDSAFIDDVYCLLRSEETNDDAQFALKDVKIINAKVKLIKCVIDNIVVDISFNQIGGVSTLCFLELVDSEIGKNHLFKKSIILIKAWCYHEGNIHGSSQWLISTYALEILILYIFNIFHKFLHGPLEALYVFLEYYSKFDWCKYCLTLNGPMPMPSRCNSTVEPVALNDELFLSNESFQGSLDRLIILPIGSHGYDKEFGWKFLNIIDPLKGDNNLGNSISKENSGLIKKAFKRGAVKLGQILKLPSEYVPHEIFQFFTTTLRKHGNGERQDIGHSMPDSGNGHGEDMSKLENSYVDKDENACPRNLLELSDKESRSGLSSFRSHSSSSSENGNAYIDLSQHILTSSTRANSLDVSGSYPTIESNWTNVHQEKWQLPPFSPSNLLGLSGDLGLHLKCLRSVQYNLEALFDKFIETVNEASLAGVLDEDFRSTALRFLSGTDARTPQQSVALSTDMHGRNSSLVNYPHGTGDIPQGPIPEVQPDALNQFVSGTNMLSSGLSLYPHVDANSEVYHHPWFRNTEDIAHTYGADVYMPDNNFPMPPRTDTLPNGLAFYPENCPFSSPYMPGDIRKSRGTGTYIPKMAHEICTDKSWYDKKTKQKELDQVSVENKLDRINSSNGHASIESTTGEPRTTEMAENCEQRYENGSIETPPLPPPRIVLPHNGGGGQGNIPVPSTGHSSPPAVTMVNSQSITSQRHENLEFGTIGPFSASLLTAKFMEDFPPLVATKKPVQAAPALAVKSPKPAASAAKIYPVEATGSTVRNPRPAASVTQSRPVEAPASTIQSPKPRVSAAQCRPEDSYQLKDDADFPPLQAGTRYNADFPPLRAAAR